MSKLDWTRAGLPNPDPAAYNPDREQRYPPTKRQEAVEKAIVEPRKPLAEALRGFHPGGLAKIGKRIAVIEKSGKPDANAFIHETALMVLEHGERHRDCGAALRLINALPVGVRRDRLVQWFLRYSPIQYVSQNKIRLAKPGDRLFKPFDIHGAKRDPFS